MCCMTERHHGYSSMRCCCSPRRFFTKEEEIEMLEDYKDQLKKELEGVDRKIKEMKETAKKK